MHGALNVLSNVFGMYDRPVQKIELMISLYHFY